MCMAKLPKNYFLLLFFILLFCNTPARANSIDSLETELATHQTRDRLRVDLLNALAEATLRQGLSEAIKYLEEAEEISSSIAYAEGKARSILLQGIIFRSEGKHDQSDEALQGALTIYKSISDKEGIAAGYYHLGILNNFRGDYAKAIEYFNLAIPIQEELGDLKKMGFSYNNRGNSYADLGDYDQAISSYTKSIELNQRIGNEDDAASGYNNIGTIYLSQQNNPKAFEYFEKALYLQKELKDSASMVNTLNNIGIMYKRWGSYDKALEYYTQAHDILEKTGDRKDIAQVKSNMGMVYFHQQDNIKAQRFLEESLQISQNINNLNHVAVCLNNIGDIHMRRKQYATARTCYQKSEKIGLELSAKNRLTNSYMGIAKSYLGEKQYDRAMAYTLKCKALAEDLGLMAHKSDVEYVLWQVYKAKGDYKNALESHEKHKVLEDSLLNSENIKKITQLEYEYKYKQELESAEKRELNLNNKVASTTKDLEKSQLYSLIAVIVILVISLVSVFIILVLKLRHARAKNHSILVEQKLLRSQMTPHFIFNSLSVLQSMILNKEEDKSIRYLSEFSKLLRTVLENSRHKSVPLSKELTAIESYMALQNLDVAPPYDFELSIAPELKDKQLEIPSMLIQPFVENAIEHAFPHQKDNREIVIDLKLEKELLICKIEDNGIGIDPNSSTTRKDSLSTVITAERLDLLSKDFKGKGMVDIQNKKLFGKKGTLVTLVIPYKTELIKIN